MNELVSCVMGTGGRAPVFIHQALRYFLAQTYEPKELVLVDSEGDIPPTPLLEDPRIRLVRIPNQLANQGERINTGIELARGDIVVKIDDDDYYSPDFLEAMVNKFHELPAGKILSLHAFPVFVLKDWVILKSDAGWFSGSAMMHRKDLWLAGKYREDVKRGSDTVFRALHKDTTVGLTRKDCYLYIRHGIEHIYEDDATVATLEVDTHRVPEDYFTPEQLAFYRELREKPESRGARIVQMPRGGCR